MRVFDANEEMKAQEEKGEHRVCSLKQEYARKNAFREFGLWRHNMARQASR